MNTTKHLNVAAVCDRRRLSNKPTIRLSTATRLLQMPLIMIACATLLAGISHADPAALVKNPPANIPVIGRVYSTSPVQSTKPAPNNLHNPAIQPSPIQPAGPLLGKAPAHGLAPAIVAGSPTPKIKTTAAVTGTGLNRKP